MEEEGGCPELPGGFSLHFFQEYFLYGPYRSPVPLLTHKFFMLLPISFSAPSLSCNCFLRTPWYSGWPWVSCAPPGCSAQRE